MKHIKECRQCEIWSKTECRIPGRSVISKRTTLMDVSERRFTPERVKNDTRKKLKASTESLGLLGVKAEEDISLSPLAKKRSWQDWVLMS